MDKSADIQPEFDSYGITQDADGSGDSSKPLYDPKDHEN